MALDKSYQDRIIAKLGPLVRSRLLPRETLALTIAIIRAAFHRNGMVYPRLAYVAHIREDGVVTVDYAATPTELEARKPIGHYTVIRDTLRTVADALDISDEDRIALFRDLRLWIGTDKRPKDVR